MQFLSDIFTSILIGYLGLTNSLADQLNQLIEGVDEPTAEVTDGTLTRLPSEYEYGGNIPDILITNAFYQQAAVLGSVEPVRPASAPIKETLVNIFCEYTTDALVRSTTGSGFFIGTDGVILTNAHVAQFLLLEDMSDNATTECIVRTGSPASPTYEAELLYISPAWVYEHADLVTAAKPRGTGERDYALLYATRRIDNQPMFNVIPAIQPNVSLPPRSLYGDPVTIGGYPSNTIIAGDLTFTPQQRVATSSIFDLFTFGSNYADLFSLTGTAIGVSGVSGGPVLNTDGDAIGIIVTRGDDSTQGDGSLNAITISYVDRTIKEETGLSLAESITGDLPRKAKIFKDTLIPFLAELLERELE